MDEAIAEGNLKTIAKQYTTLINAIMDYFEIDKPTAQGVIARLCNELFIE